MNIDKPTRILAILLAAGALSVASAQRVATLEIEVENSVVYRYDQGDPSLWAKTSTPVPAAFDKAFVDFCQLGDIVSVNGSPAKGLHMTCGTRMGFSATPQPGFAIADVSMGSGRQECNWELYTAEGRFVGRFVDGGFFPHAVQGGAGAYFGATGEHQSTGVAPARVASVTEDPSRRRVNGGGGKYRVTYVIKPAVWPEIVLIDGAPAVFHSDLETPVDDAHPAQSGETIIIVAKGLGPTLPGVVPQGARVFASQPPFNEVNSPVEVTVSGAAGEILNKIGWPGTTDTYRVDVRLPSGLTPGTAKLVLTSAWIPSEEVAIRIR